MPRRRPPSIPDDPTLAEDLLGVPRDAQVATPIDNRDIVDSDDRELGRLLAERAPRAHLPWVTAVLGALILLSAGYVAGGYHYRNSGGSGTGTATGFAAARAAATGARGAEGGAAATSSRTAPSGTTGTTGGAGRFGAAGGATIGTVKLVDGNNVYLTDTSGATIKVTLAPKATVTVTKAGKLSDLAPGTTVVVVGQTAADGTVTATAVTQGGGGAGGFGAGGFGAGRTGAGGAGG
jgi:hypothetical protein